MNTKKEFNRIISTQTEIALATSSKENPNVRIVNYIYDKALKVIYFATFSDNAKVQEFSENTNIAFTTIPQNSIEHIRAQGAVKQSKLTIFDVKEQFISKIPHYEETIEQAGQFLTLFEITFESAIVTLDFENIDTLML